jgi:rhodanese-related sulfurtransferase
MYDSIDINEIDQIHITSNNTIDSNQRILIDIRDKYEYILGNIKGSVNIPYNYLALMPENYLNLTSIYYIYCDSGNKSRKLCLHLKQLGYKVIDLIGGYQNYHK